MFIGRELKKKNGFLDHPRMIAETRKVFERMALTLDPRAMVRELDASYKQIVEISRAHADGGVPDHHHGRAHHLAAPTRRSSACLNILRTLQKQNVGHRLHLPQARAR